jgi:peptide/nickel transport system permease protein
VLRYVLRRLLLAVPTLLGVSVATFLMIHLIPGNIVQVMLGTRTDVTPAQVHQLERLYGIDVPLYLQYLRWMAGVLHGDLGFSLRTGFPVTSLIGQSFAVTGELALMALVLAALFAIPAGTLAGYRRDGALDVGGRVFALVAYSMPSFWLGTLLVLWAAGAAPALSSFRYVPFGENPVVNVESLILPAVSLAAGLSALILRTTRAEVLEVLRLMHVRTARAKGLGEGRVVTAHVLRNALLPVVTVLGIEMGYLLGGAIVVENVFALPGIGRLVVQAIQNRDYPLVQGSILFVAVLFVLVNLAVDLSYAALDPRVRYE